jgi:hypothetical protein
LADRPLITTNNLLFELARSINSGNPQPDDSDLVVGRDVSPTITLRSACDVPQIITIGNVQQSSFNVNADLEVNGGSGAISTTVANVGKGLWEFDCFGSMNSNYVDTSTTFEQRVHLVWAGGIIVLMGFKASGALAAPVGQSGTRRLTVLIPTTPCIVVKVANNNAAGQACNSFFSIFATRLL